MAEDAGALASSHELRELMAGDLGATVESVADYEVSAFEAGPGTFARVSVFTGSPESLEEGLRSASRGTRSSRGRATSSASAA